MNLRSIANQIFRQGLKSVLPRSLILDNVTVSDNQLCIGEKKFPVKNNVYVVGFGKAVIGMGAAVEEVLNSHIIKGILSVPAGAKGLGDRMGDHPQLGSRSKILAQEGAEDNIPDHAAFATALEIEKLVKSLREDDLLLMLVSGGGSALLPCPVEGVLLEDKIATIKLLASEGATIQELNTIRKHLSRLKGGKLASMAKCKTIVSLILSDIVADPLELIASGPTVPDNSTIVDCMKILETYNLQYSLPESVAAHFLQKEHEFSNLCQSKADCLSLPNVHNIVIGNNRIAVENCRKAAMDNGFLPFIISCKLTGNVKDVSKSFADILIWFLYDIMPQEQLSFEEGVVTKALSAFKSGRPVCLLSAGETTVNITGSGRGGRNQELVLRTSEIFDNKCKELDLMMSLETMSFCFLSAGTDGQDGPTPATGAFFTGNFFEKVQGQKLSIRKYLEDNGSYDFFSLFDGGSNLIVTGLTGTNVMDIQVLLIQKL